jgi:hypothetical protein
VKHNLKPHQIIDKHNCLPQLSPTMLGSHALMGTT